MINWIWIPAAVYIVICTVTDMKSRQISIVVSIIFGIIGTVILLSGKGAAFTSGVFGAVTGGAVILLSKLTNGAIGMGDGTAFTVIGIYIGAVKNIELFLVSSFLCAIVSVVMLLTGKYKNSYSLPFMPFVACATVITAITEGVL